MKRIYVTFGDERFAKSRDFGVKMATLVGGFDMAIGYSMDDIPEDFKKKHHLIFNIKRGAGLWLWKPYLIYKTLTEIANEGDMVFYAVGGSFFIRNIKHIERSMGANDIWVSWIPFVESQFTKADTFVLMDCEKEDFKRSAQIQGGFIYVRKSIETINFIKEWLDYCCDINILHPDNLCPGIKNDANFIAHREDQSVLSLLCKKHRIIPHLDPSQYGKYPYMYGVWGFDRPAINYNEEYPVSIILHRSPNINVIEVIKLFILSIIPKRLGEKLANPQMVSEEKRNALKH